MTSSADQSNFMSGDPKKSGSASSSRANSVGNAKVIKTRCPHCRAVNSVDIAQVEEVFQCAHCDKMFRLRKKVAGPPPAPVIATQEKRFPIRCACQAKLSVTYADFGKRVKCESCNKVIRIPDWVAESRFTDDEFDDMFSEEERQAFKR